MIVQRSGLQVKFQSVWFVKGFLGSGSFKYSLCFWIKPETGIADNTYIGAHATALDTANPWDASAQTMSPYLSRLLYTEVVVTNGGNDFTWNSYISTKGNSDEQVFTKLMVNIIVLDD